MIYTFAQLKKAVEHAVAGAPDSRTSRGEIVNRALDYLYKFKDWSWRLKVTDLNATNAQSYIALPADFGELVQVSSGAGSGFKLVKQCTPYELVSLRRQVWPGNTLGYVLSAIPQTDRTQAPVQCLQIGPTPTGALAPCVTVVYQKQPQAFVTSDADASQDAFYPDVPDGQMDTLIALCRAFAVSTEEQTSGEDWRLATELLQRDAAADDRRAADNRGVLEDASQGAYTYLTLKTEAEDAAGKDFANKHTAGRIVNRAIEHLCNFTSWRWRNTIVAVDFVAGAEQIPLPGDFGELVAVYGFTSKYTACRAMDPEEILAIRTHGVSDSLFLGYMVGIAAQTDPTAPPARVLEVAPTPATSIAQAIRICYRKIIPTLSNFGTADDLKVPAVPVGMQSCLLQLVRAFAAQQTDPKRGQMEWQLANQMLETAKATDSKADAPNLGPIQGGYVEDYYDSSLIFRPFTEIKTPYDP